VSTFWEDRLRECQAAAARPVRPAGWLYPLDYRWVDFFTGTRGGEQVLIGPYEQSLIACFFDPAGVLRGVEERRQKAAPDPDPERDAVYLDILREASRDPPRIPPRYLEALAWNTPPLRQAWNWAEQVGVEFGPVWIRRFALPGKRIGIEDGNRLAEQGIWEGGEHDSAEAWLRSWLASGHFVVWWSRDLWVDGTGHVFAT
jgi:hypothetical protein